jgi:hypothetical protein
MYIRQLLNLIYNYDDFFKENNIKFGDLKNFKNLNVKYKDQTYKIIYDDQLYFMKSEDEADDCITIGVDKKNKTVSINNISSEGSFICFKNINEKIGTHLLLLAIKIAKKLKDRIPEINRIILTDNSKLHCSEQKDKRVIFSDLRQIISGDTFYGKHGFKPIHEEDVKNYNKNKKVLSKLLVDDIDFEKYFNSFSKENKDTNLDKLINFVKKNKKMKVGKFIEILSDSYNLIDYLLKKIYKKCNLESMHNVKFEMYI